MKIDAARLCGIARELIDENRFAIRALLRIASVELSKAVPSAAVTCEERPRLLVNAAFVERHCRTEDHLKALLCHEFLHVLLRHTEERRPPTPARHLALDAVINAIIHRTCGPAYSSLMAGYYAKEEGLLKLLRPRDDADREAERQMHLRRALVPQWLRAWEALYAGRMVADDIEDIATACAAERGAAGQGARGVGNLLGNHDAPEILAPPLADALDQALREMDGHGIWRSPGARGIGANPYAALVSGATEPLRRWREKSLAVLLRCLTPDPRSRHHHSVPRDYTLPVLAPGDRRAMLRTLWHPFLPEAQWQGIAPRQAGTAQVYLDVSGSMNHEMPLLIGLLAQLSRHIRRPFWAFSDVLAPTLIERGQLKAQTTSGTSMACVLQHLAQTRPAAAVVVTDGYIETLRPAQVKAASATRLHVLLTRDGSPALLHRAGIPYTQLDRVPR